MTRPSRRACTRPPAFTLIEILTVIAIIGILSTLLVIGIGHLRVNAQRQQTRQTLQTAQALWASYDAVSKLQIESFATDAPGFADTGQQFVVTNGLFAQMRTVPSVVSMLDKIPNNQRYLMPNQAYRSPTDESRPGFVGLFNSAVVSAAQPWVTGTPTSPYKPGNGGLYTIVTRDSSATATTGLLSGSGGLNYYVCIRSHVASDGTNGTANFPPNPAYWMPMATYVAGATPVAPVPVLADAWGSPIMVVPGGTLSNVTAGGVVTSITSPDKRLYFVSAGPDLSFAKGDDNLSSFEEK